MTTKRHKVKSSVYKERHRLISAFCDVGVWGDCTAMYTMRQSPTDWARKHTLETGHITVVKHEKSWNELIESVEES